MTFKLYNIQVKKKNSLKVFFHK